MITERRFLVASSLARLIQRERGTAGRIVEAYFPPKSDRRQLVRVEQQQSRLILLSLADDGQFLQEETAIPQRHAEGLIDVAAGTVAYDRVSLALGRDIEATLDRFIVPRELDFLTVSIPSNPHAFAPLPWFGLEVTDEPAFTSFGLALDAAPNVDAMEPSNAALEALLDTLEGRSLYQLRPPVSVDAGANLRTEEQPTIPTAIGLDAFVPRSAANSHQRRTQTAGETISGDLEDDSCESLARRRLARSHAPRSDDGG